MFVIFFGQGVPMQLHSSEKYNPLPSALASQSSGGYNFNNRIHTQSEYEIDLQMQLQFNKID